MNSNEIDTAFVELINQRGIHTKLDETSNAIRSLRARLSRGESISTDRKLELLKKSGWKMEDTRYTRADLVSLLNFYKTTSQLAREQGPEYVIEKWERSGKGM